MFQAGRLTEIKVCHLSDQIEISGRVCSSTVMLLSLSYDLYSPSGDSLILPQELNVKLKRHKCSFIVCAIGQKKGSFVETARRGVNRQR